MDKTVTANFESIDLATFAAKNVTNHFGTVKRVKVTYEKQSAGEQGGILGMENFLLPYGPYNSMGTLGGMGIDGTTNGMAPAIVAMAEKRRREGDDSMNRRKAKVSITAPEDIIRQIESTLYTGGGLGIQVS